ncbi:hypothetical protein FKM82_024282 [Ascaphus truei]
MRLGGSGQREHPLQLEALLRDLSTGQAFARHTIGNRESVCCHFVLRGTGPGVVREMLEMHAAKTPWDPLGVSESGAGGYCCSSRLEVALAGDA